MCVYLCVNMTKDFKVLYERVNRISFFLQKKNKRKHNQGIERKVLLLVQRI